MIVKFCLSLFLLWLQYVKASAATKPNILMIVIDDLGWNDTSYKGSDIPTPNIDKFAKEGIRLQQYYVQRICSPTRAAIMAGRYPYYMGLAHEVITNGYPMGLPLNQTTIGNELKKGGYTTHYVGKWDLGMYKWEFTPTYRGFDSFYGYYDAAEDYYTHTASIEFPGPLFKWMDNADDEKLSYFEGIDFRNNTDPVTDKNGTYSTTLFTEAIEQAIEKHDSDKGPFFIYAAYQSVHSPLEAPQKYIDQCKMPYKNRRIFCGMLKAADEGIGNITTLLQEKNLLDDTIIIFTTDNGGQTSKGSSNWPLRGNKATVFEGGVRGTAFVWGSNLPKLNYDNYKLIHATDWLPTIVEGIAGLELDEDKWKLDGYNVWPTITNDTETPRKEILINLDPPSSDFIGQAAIRSGDWKLIMGMPNCSLVKHFKGDPCPDGWIHLDGTIEPPPYTPSLLWLFNIVDDPNERENVADLYPLKVHELMERLKYYNSIHVEQLRPRLDFKSNPKYFDGVWTPWVK